MFSWWHPLKILIRLRECAGWSESSLGAHIQRYVFWRWGSNVFSWCTIYVLLHPVCPYNMKCFLESRKNWRYVYMYGKETIKFGMASLLTFFFLSDFHRMSDAFKQSSLYSLCSEEKKRHCRHNGATTSRRYCDIESMLLHCYATTLLRHWKDVVATLCDDVTATLKRRCCTV